MTIVADLAQRASSAGAPHSVGNAGQVPLKGDRLRSGFWVLGSGFWVLGSGFWVLGSGFWVLGSGFWWRSRGALSILRSTNGTGWFDPGFGDDHLVE
jgi:hypothetical protein